MKSNVTQGCTAKTLHNTLSDCAYLFKNLRFLTVTVSEIYLHTYRISYRLRNDLYCVGWGVKLYSIQSNLIIS